MARYYVDGNTVRELEPARRSREDIERIQRQKKRRNAARRNREKNLVINRTYALFLAVCVILSVMAATVLIRTQASISTHLRNISSVESKLTDLKLDNDAKNKALNTSINLNEIKTRAMEELGMKYPTEDQVIYYSVESDNFMDQYRDIPK